ncbi:hypothetical protein [Corynebacterium amycolatum]|uniref:hypothetical protein n=1 Tax=Corynebacterium amycolatum TaxID=43765 RepID=UPI00191D039A|nr:hypothetical protein [Corynebacterium amycolatum]QQU97790.1 hypothetical protein I6I65_10735 [Corynebacterium amycolatum]
MHIRPDVGSYSPSDLSWLGSRHAVDEAETGTLGEKTTHIRMPVLPSGTALRRDGDYWLPVTSKSQQVDGFLLTDQDNNPGEIVPIIWHGRIRVDRLPDSNNRVHIAECDHPEFTFVREPGGSLWNEDGSKNFDQLGEIRGDN